MKIRLKRLGQVLMMGAALTMTMGSCSSDDEPESGTTNPEVTYQGNVAYSKVFYLMKRSWAMVHRISTSQAMSRWNEAPTR